MEQVYDSLGDAISQHLNLEKSIKSPSIIEVKY
jgi:hypothetical protein